MNKLKIAFKHFRTINKHKRLVMFFCFKVGLISQGIKHDLSKYSRIEFWNGVKYYTGINSPISNEKADKGYSLMWLNHMAKNKHHWEYWIYFKLGVPYAAKMPKNYLVEHVIDSISAAKVYGGKNFTHDAPLKYVQKEPYRLYHEDTRHEVLKLLSIYAKMEEKAFIKYLRNYLKEAEYGQSKSDQDW